MRIEKEIGDGEDYVYVYYNPNDKKLATFEGRDRWECKIGFSSTDPIQRIVDQGIKTSISQDPVIGLLIRTENGYYTEALLHKHLYQYKIRSDIVGDEWFMTNPNEIENILLNDVLPISNDLVKYCEYQISDTNKLGNILNLHRKKVNLTNDKLTQKIGISRDTLWRCFNGNEAVSLSTVIKILSELELEITVKSKLPSNQIKIHTSKRKAR